MPNRPTFDTPHSITLSVQDWLGVLCAISLGQQHCTSIGWDETAAVQGKLLDKLAAQVRDQIDAAGDADELQSLVAAE